MQAATHVPEMQAVDELSSLIIRGVFRGLIDREETSRTRRLCSELIEDYRTLNRLRFGGSNAEQISIAEQCVRAGHDAAVELIAHFRLKLL